MRLCGLYAYGSVYGVPANGDFDDQGDGNKFETQFLKFRDCGSVSLREHLRAGGGHGGIALSDGPPMPRCVALKLLGINMAVNHSLHLPDVDSAISLKQLEESLVGVSQDEKAFAVAASALLGVHFVQHDQGADTITLSVDVSNTDLSEADKQKFEKNITLRIIETFDYSTARKRMGFVSNLRMHLCLDAAPVI